MPNSRVRDGHECRSIARQSLAGSGAPQREIFQLTELAVAHRKRPQPPKAHRRPLTVTTARAWRPAELGGTAGLGRTAGRYEDRLLSGGRPEGPTDGISLADDELAES